MIRCNRKKYQNCHSEQGTSEEFLLGSRRRFFFASLIRVTHIITFYDYIMKRQLCKVFFIILLLHGSGIYAQQSSKWDGYWEKPLDFTPEPHIQHTSPGLFQSSALVWIRIYQNGISSQDLPACVFHPSCSRFAFGAIERYGLFRGILLAGDRLLRCNPFAHNYYQFDGEKFSDPVTNYQIKKP